MKKQEKIVLILLGILVISLLILNFSKINLTGNSILEKYTYTKALCNNSGHCEDFFIECNGQNLEKLTPTGFSIESNNKENLNESLCN